MSSRECPVPGCKDTHPPAHLMCRHHWYKVPKPLRDEVWDSYRRDGVLSDRYRQARDEAIKAAHEG